MADNNCTLCDGMGMRIIRNVKGKTEAQPCECHIPSRNAELLRRSQIPERYKSCTLESYRYDYENAHPSLYRAFGQAHAFAQNYLDQPPGQGLLFTGTIGTGKTHLAVGILQDVVHTLGIRALFCDQGGLLRDVSSSFKPGAEITEMEVLKPILDAELLVLDELGRFKKSEWVSDIVAHVLNVRYNDRRTTIITTNYENRPPKQTYAQPDAEWSTGGIIRKSSIKKQAGENHHDLEPFDILNRRLAGLIGGKAKPLVQAPSPGPESQSPASKPAEGVVTREKQDAAGPRKQVRVDTSETLGDRIGERVRSRLAEMCVTVEMVGADYRDGQKRAYLY